MTIDPNKTYRTRDGRAVRIYAVDAGGSHPIHGAVWYGHHWQISAWRHEGRTWSTPQHYSHFDLIEVTLADKIRDQIPWEALRTEFRFVAMDEDGCWCAFTAEPRGDNGGWWMMEPHITHHLFPVVMPEVDPSRWRETLVERPDDR